ncbi:MAG: flagellar export protein FliJ [Heliobacteriaceae bacterium]|nr:flagellar export protein FliJ [Heliobacteriaceae bacterium]MDD4587071.1 flagellar export protein FliJ [Heliobacteriaceae bacterium]
MKRFQFKLQTVLELKRRQETALKGDLARQLDQVEHCAGLLAATRATQAEALSQNRVNTGQSVDVASRRLFHHYWQRLKRVEAIQESHLVKEEEKLAAVRQELLGFMRDRKVLEKLREKHLAEYQKEVLWVEQQMMDELALNRFARSTDKEE